MSRLIKSIFAKVNPKKLRRFAVSLVIYGVIFFTAIYWQQKDMLATGSHPFATPFYLLDLAGNLHTIDLTKTEHRYLIYFFAPWCKICHLSIDNLESIHQQQIESADIKVIAIALDWSTKNEVLEFLTQHQLSMPVLLGTKHIQAQFKIDGFPSYYLISKQGEVVAKGKGYSSEIGMKLKLAVNQ